MKQVDDVVRPGDALCEFHFGEGTSPSEPVEPTEDVSVDATETQNESNAAETVEPDIVEEPLEASDESEIEDDGFVEIDFGAFVESISPEEPETASVVESVEEPESTETSPEEYDETADDLTVGDAEVQAAGAEETDGGDTEPEPHSDLDQTEVSALREVMDDKRVRRERLSRRRFDCGTAHGAGPS